ncbi:MAG TPA: hypothetical protein VG273_27940 [Bryobacteraceae bacterium]|nr:hypothetical protein [Bryobacteraceae bacterium]
MEAPFRAVLPLMILAAGFALIPRSSFAIQRYTPLTGQPCAYCHVNMMNKLLLTDAGKYFQKHHTFEGYQPKQPPPGKK